MRPKRTLNSASTTTALSIGYESKRYFTRSILSTNVLKQLSQGPQLSAGLSLQVLNPKSLDEEGQKVLKAILKLYGIELPEMSFAANTGKESPFLEKCVTGGKYCTLALKRTTELDCDEVLAAISFQILPPDTQYAEIPLAAVNKNHQHKGIGSYLFNELQKRLHDVGVLTIFCWGDQESEDFWIKQGFVKVAEVDVSGKSRKLPIKPDIRRAMSIPGSATLLVSHLHGSSTTALLDGNSSDRTPQQHKSCTMEGVSTGAVQPSDFAAPRALKPSPAAGITTPTATEIKLSLLATPAFAVQEKGALKSSGSKGMIPLNMDGVLSSVATPNKVRKLKMKENFEKNDLSEAIIPLTLASQFHGNDHSGCSPLFEEVDAGHCATPTSLKQEKENMHPIVSAQKGRKRGRGFVSCKQMPRKLLNCCKEDIPFNSFHHGALIDMSRLSDVVPVESPVKVSTMAQGPCTTTLLQQQFPNGNTTNCLPSGHMGHVVMLMNMADDKRRAQLTKLVEKLGGTVTNDGSLCTHVVTGEARRTLNFCTALNAGAWVVSPAWLKASVKEKKFVEETPFVLKDEAFEQKYKSTVYDAIQRAMQKPHGLLEGMFVYPTPHVQPPIEILTPIILSAGGKVLSSLEEVQDLSRTVAVVCEDDISEAFVAAKAGLPTYSSEWLMCCIMKQELDLMTTQFHRVTLSL